jgi:hypothetical protein
MKPSQNSLFKDDTYVRAVAESRILGLVHEIKRREAAPTSVPSTEYVNIAWGVCERVVEWTPQPMAFYPSALHTIRLK